MRIRIDRNVVEFTPENDQETSELEALWRIVIDCVKDSRKLAPIGEYLPAKNNMARFVIEEVS